MSYYDVIKRCDTVGSLSRDEEAFMALLSPEAEDELEESARKANEITLRYFGRTIQLYTPIYVSNYCDNHCVYCGFKAGNPFERSALTLEEVRREAEFVAQTGLKHILLLTGDSRSESPVSYIRDCVKVLKEYFTSIAIEVYALAEGEYRELISEGVDSLTIYQETYDEALYKMLHPRGPKSDYLFRLDAPERGARAGMRSVNIGVLLGLGDWRRDVYLMGLHAKYLQDKFPDVEVGVSIPRFRPHSGDFVSAFRVSDKNIVQIITALRIFLPRLGISVSTREAASLRDNIIPLGITRMSAGSTTCVGGRTKDIASGNDAPQFEISDKRGVAEIKALLERKGYQPVLKDWVGL